MKITSTEYQMRQRDDERDRIVSLATDARILGDSRMLRDDEKYTDEVREIIVDRFRAALTRAGKGNAWAARSMGISPATLSLVLSNSYTGDTEGMIRKIDKWTENYLARESAPGPGNFAKTSVALEIIGAAKVAINTNSMVVVHGPSGIGKTLAAKFIRADTPGAIYISITTAGVGIHAIYDMLSRELRIPKAGLTAAQKELAVKAALQSNGESTRRLIIVDEAHQLCIRRRDQGLHALRHLHDLTECPMILLGTTDIVDYIADGRNASESVEQIYGRVAWWLDLTSAAAKTDGGPGLHTIDDIRLCLAAHQIRVTPDAEKWLHNEANHIAEAGLRNIMTLCKMAVMEFGASKPFTLEQLRDLQDDRRGKWLSRAKQANAAVRNERKAATA